MTTTMVPEWTFGDRLRKARTSTGTSAESIAQRAGRSRRAVESWEKGGRQPRDVFGIARLYAELTGVDYDWLLTGVRTGSSQFGFDGLGLEIAA